MGFYKFIRLRDTPDSYSGQAGKHLRVKPTEDGLEFVPSPGWVKIYDYTFPSAVQYVDISGWNVTANKMFIMYLLVKNDNPTSDAIYRIYIDEYYDPLSYRSNRDGGAVESNPDTINVRRGHTTIAQFFIARAAGGTTQINWSATENIGDWIWSAHGAWNYPVAVTWNVMRIDSQTTDGIGANSRILVFAPLS